MYCSDNRFFSVNYSIFRLYERKATCCKMANAARGRCGRSHPLKYYYYYYVFWCRITVRVFAYVARK